MSHWIETLKVGDSIFKITSKGQKFSENVTVEKITKSYITLSDGFRLPINKKGEYVSNEYDRYRYYQSETAYQQSKKLLVMRRELMQAIENNMLPYEIIENMYQLIQEK